MIPTHQTDQAARGTPSSIDPDLQMTLNAHAKWLRSEGGERANLEDADLEDADLEDANLEDADLRHANLRNADLRHANLRNADLRHADLRNADLRGANLLSANLRYADLRGADLRGANLRYATLRGADLRIAIGNGREIKSMQLDYTITWTKDALAIGCQQHSIADWLAMDYDTLRGLAPDVLSIHKFYTKYGDLIKTLITNEVKN